MSLHRWWSAVWALVALTAALPLARTAEAEHAPPLLVATAPAGGDRIGAEHLWIVIWQPKSGARSATGFGSGSGEFAAKLLHSPPENPGTIRAVAEHSVMPIAIAAYADRIWLVLPPTSSFPNSRDVVMHRIEWNLATKQSFAQPAAGILLPSLPSDGDLVGFAADAHGVWALIPASAAAQRGVQREGASEAGRREANLYYLSHEMRSGAWQQVDLPRELALADGLARGPSGVAVLAPIGSRERSESAKTDSAPSESATRIGLPTLAERTAGEHLSAVWQLEEVPVPRRVASHMVQWMDAGGRWAFVEHRSDAPRTVDLRYWLDGRILPWTNVSFDQEGWAIGAAGAGAIAVQLLESQASRDGKQLPTVERAHIGTSVTGEDPPFVRLSPPGFGAAAWIHVPLLMMMAMGALMIFAFVRVIASPEQARESLDVPALALHRRVGALAIDLLPPAVVVMLLMRVPPVELLQLPSWTVDLPRSLPALLVIAGLCIHTAISEWMGGSTLGKRLAGAVVVSADGSPPRLIQVLLRSAFKALVLAAPILSVFMLFQRDRRGIGDIASGTVVIDTHPASGEPLEHDE